MSQKKKKVVFILISICIFLKTLRVTFPRSDPSTSGNTSSSTSSTSARTTSGPTSTSARTRITRARAVKKSRPPSPMRETTRDMKILGRDSVSLTPHHDDDQLRESSQHFPQSGRRRGRLWWSRSRSQVSVRMTSSYWRLSTPPRPTVWLETPYGGRGEASWGHCQGSDWSSSSGHIMTRPSM